MKTIEGSLINQGYKIAIIASRFNDFIVSHLIQGAVDILKRHDIRDEDMTMVRVPGAFELPRAAKVIATKKIFDGIICLGALIRGETYHFEMIAQETTKGLAEISLEYDVPVSFGVLAAETLEQAIERSGVKGGNKGAEVALSCLEMINLEKRIARGELVI